MAAKNHAIATFHKTFCLKLILLSLFLMVASIVMVSTSYVLFGIVIPAQIRMAIAILGILIGLWFLYAGIERFLSEDSAASTEDNTCCIHVNPGRKLALPKSSIVGISKPSDLRGIKKLILSPKIMYIRTALREGVWAPSVTMGSSLIVEDIDVIHDDFINYGHPTDF